MTSSDAAPRTNPGERERISCPGCGRHDWVAWPENQETFHWTCFNCRKQFDLHRGGRH
jgi:transposase-like protein